MMEGLHSPDYGALTPAAASDWLLSPLPASRLVSASLLPPSFALTGLCVPLSSPVSRAVSCPLSSSAALPFEHTTSIRTEQTPQEETIQGQTRNRQEDDTQMDN